MKNHLLSLDELTDRKKKTFWTYFVNVKELMSKIVHNDPEDQELRHPKLRTPN